MHLVWLRIRTEMIFWYGFKFFKSFTHLSGKSERPQLRQGSGTFSLGTSTLVAFGLDFCFPKRWICPIDGSSFCVSCNVFFTRFFSCILKKKKIFFFLVLTLQKKIYVWYFLPSNVSTIDWKSHVEVSHECAASLALDPKDDPVLLF